MKTKLIITALFVLAGVAYSCTDLSETVRDTALGQEVLEQPDAPEQTLAPVYAGMQNLMASHNWLNNLQSISSYEQITPFRGGTDWFDGGRFIEMHEHTWAPSHVSVIDVWGGATQGVARAAIAERNIQDLGGGADLAAEARGLKAVYNYWLLDLFNVSFDKKGEDIGTNNLSIVYRDTEAVDYILSEIEQIEDQLPSVNEVGETRLTRAAVIGLKARLLLNKAIYANRYAAPESQTFEASDMQSVIEFTTEIINSGDYSLETEDYFNMFGLENEGHPELIFAFEQNESTGGYGSMAWFQSSRNRHRTPANPGAVGSDGSAMTQEFYDLWEGFRDDPRFFTRNIPDGGSVPDEEFAWNRGIQIGQQYGIEFVDGSQSQFKRDENGDLLIVPLTDFARSGEPMVYTREIGITTDSGHLAGARSLKWDLDPTTVNRGDSNINMPWLRLGEVYLMRAEAYARTGNWGQALNDINTLRAARGARQLQATELDAFDELEREWYFEMYHEHWTRTIQIRFGNWEETWRDKTSTEEYRRVFPIPQEAIDLAQSEPGYLEQNPGY